MYIDIFLYNMYISTGEISCRSRRGHGYHWISQKETFCEGSLACSCSGPGWPGPVSLFGLPASEPPRLPWGQSDCHLSWRVDTIGGRDGLFRRILSISVIVATVSLGISYRAKDRDAIFKLMGELM